MATIPEEEKQRRLELVREALKRSPELTKSHFQRAYGFSYQLTEWMEKQGVVFGQPRKFVFRLRS